MRPKRSIPLPTISTMTSLLGSSPCTKSMFSDVVERGFVAGPYLAIVYVEKANALSLRVQWTIVVLCCERRRGERGREHARSRDIMLSLVPALRTTLVRTSFSLPQLLSTQSPSPARLYRRSSHPSNFALPMQRSASPYPGSPTPNVMKKSRVLVLGAGNFGSCLADHLADSSHDVLMWSREAELVSYFNTHHRNPNYLKDHAFSRGITAIGPEMPGKDVINGVDVVLFAIPTEGVRWVRPFTSTHR